MAVEWLSSGRNSKREGVGRQEHFQVVGSKLFRGLDVLVFVLVLVFHNLGTHHLWSISSEGKIPRRFDGVT